MVENCLLACRPHTSTNAVKRDNMGNRRKKLLKKETRK